jgi:hypothetical protein
MMMDPSAGDLPPLRFRACGKEALLARMRMEFTVVMSTAVKRHPVQPLSPLLFSSAAEIKAFSLPPLSPCRPCFFRLRLNDLFAVALKEPRFTIADCRCLLAAPDE